MAANGKTMSKTDAIRQALKTTKTGSPSEVAKILNKQGVKVSAAYVSTIKAADKRRAQLGVSTRKPGRPPSAPVSATAASGDITQASALMLDAVDLVLKAGAKEAKQLVDMAERMVNRIQ